MKHLKYLVVALIPIVAAACYEVNEEITIDKNGKGTYITKMDMGSMLELMKTMASEEELNSSGLGRSIDTTIDMKSLLDSAQDVPADQRRLLSGGIMKFQMDMNQSVMNVNVQFPFSSFSDLQSLMAGAAAGGLGDVMAKVMANKDSSQAMSPADQNSLNQLNNVFNVTVNNKLISKQLNRQKFDSLMNRPELAQMKQMAGAGLEVLYTTTIRLPRPVKKFDNNDFIRLSDDKKVVTIRYDLLKILEAPEKFSYSIEY